jgi:hypothetical protein
VGSFLPVVVVVVATSAACGLSVTGTGTGSAEPSTDVGDTTPRDPDAEPSSITAAPATPADASTAVDAPEASAPAGRSLQCRAHEDCPGDDRCCFDPRARTSSCHKSCPDNQLDLCVYVVGLCGDDRKCLPMSDPPQAVIGQCVKT